MKRLRAVAGALEKARVGEIRLQERLADYTSLKVGGPCLALVRPPDLASLVRLVHTLGEIEVPYFPLGGGSNLLVADEGFEGVAISTDALQQWEQPDPQGLEVGAGVVTARVLKWTIRQNLAGFEGLTGVPGSIGGACVMNAGGRGGTISDSLRRVWVVTPPPEVHTVEVEAEALGLAYRTASLPAGSIVAAARFHFQPDPRPGGVAGRVEELMAHRMTTQPAGVLSAGSMFKNPPGDAAGRLIDTCGLKGTREGAAEVSEQHANYIVNTGGATAVEVRRLIERVRETVQRKNGIRLEMEVAAVGFAGDPVPARVWMPAGGEGEWRRRRGIDRVVGRPERGNV